MSRRKFSKDFKLNIVKLVINQVHTPSQLAQKYELQPNMVYRWVKELEIEFDDIQAKQKSLHVQDELVDLRNKLKRLEMENKTLKGAIAALVA